jgi:CDP-ribitol ribitolphosphotransferase
LSAIVPVDIELHQQVQHQIIQELRQNICKRSAKRTGKMSIALQNYNYSSYHGYALYRFMPAWIREKYVVDLLDENDYDVLQSYDVICSSFFEGVYDSQHTNIELWHGFPLKRLGCLHDEQVDEAFLNIHAKRERFTHLIMSYSQLYTTFFNSGYPSVYAKYRITGMPRNDLLFEPGAREKLQMLSGVELGERRVVFYMPTWRKSKHLRVDGERDWQSLFGLPDETQSDVLQMIEQLNIFLVVKLHPYEYEQFQDYSLFDHPNVYLMHDDELIKKRLHLYEILSASDILITDYSSVAYDMLLVDTPMIFIRTDEQQYGEKRGFIVEPIDFFAPGKGVRQFADLMEEMTALLRGDDEFCIQRQQLKSMVFKHHDAHSSERVWREIDEYLSKNR